MNPLLQFIVIFHVFHPILGQEMPSYPLYLFLGLILWEYFSIATSALIAVPQKKLPILQKRKVWPPLFLLASAWTSLMIFCTRFMLFLLFALMLGMPLSHGAFWYLPVMILQMVLLTLGVGSFLSAFSLRFKDIPHLWTVTLQILFWLTPVVYAPFRTGDILQEISKVSPSTFSSVLTSFMNMQPLSILLFDARRAFGLLPMAPPSLFHILLFTVACAIVCWAGMALYARRSTYFLQEY